MFKYMVYLVGQVNANPETYKWREEVNKYFENNNHVEILNPCNDEFHYKQFSTDSTIQKVSKNEGISLLPHRDRKLVKLSNVGFVNMNTYLSKPFIGSFFELAWYFDTPEKIIIGIFQGDPTKVIECNHPFVKETIQIWVKHHIQACKMLEKFINF
jgi:hypothetical protein